MKQLAFLTVLSLGIGLSVSLAAAQERYVRKPLPQPDFFVPQKDVEYQEKLPPFYIPEVQPQAEAVVEESSPTIEFQPQANSQPKASSEPEFNPELDVKLDDPAPLPTTDETPKYQQEYNSYLQDLSAIAQTGQAPKNPELENDLSALSNDNRLEVKEDGQISPRSSSEELINPMALAQALPQQNSMPVSTEAQIIDRVEIINLPDSLKQKKKSSLSETEPENYENPFAQAEEISLPKGNSTTNDTAPAQPVIANPEVAAHFRGGSNPFAPQTIPEPSDTENTVAADSEPSPEAEETQSEESVAEEPQPLPALTEPQPSREPKISRNAGRRSRSSSSSMGSGASFGLGPNMVR